MKYLSDYMNEPQTALFDETNSFFAFSEQQFNEGILPGKKYVSLGAGLYCPAETAKQLVSGLEQIHQNAMKQDIAENGARAIIARELWNHECFYTNDYTPAREALEPYGFDESLINQTIKEEWQRFKESDFQ